MKKKICILNGNIDLIKVMALLNSDAIKYENYRINKIESINIWQQTACCTVDMCRYLNSIA